MAPANVDTMMYYGKTPWHRIGTELDRPATAEEAIAAAQMDWEVSKQPCFYYDLQRQEYVEYEDKKVLMRMDNWTPFDVRSNRYTPFQNAEKFSFFDEVIGAGQAIYHTAGSLAGGAVTWILAKLPSELKLADNEVLEKYILLADSYNGTASFTMKPTSVRVVCQNTLSIALGDNEMTRMFRARHTGDWKTKANEARKVMGLQEAYFAMLMLGANAMGNTTLTEAEVEPFLVRIFGQEEMPENINKTTRNQMDRVKEILYHDGIQIAGDNRWDLLQSVTQYVDHERGGKTNPNLTQAQEDRMRSSMFGGSGQQMKQKAWDILLPEGVLEAVNV